MASKFILHVWPVLLFPFSATETLGQLHQQVDRLSARRPGTLLCVSCISTSAPGLATSLAGVNTSALRLSPDCDRLRNGTAAVGVTFCDSACVKIVSENQYLSLTVRGCLTQLFRGVQHFSWVGCDLQQSDSLALGHSLTETCLCADDNLCNGGGGFGYVCSVVIVCLMFLSLLARL